MALKDLEARRKYMREWERKHLSDPTNRKFYNERKAAEARRRRKQQPDKVHEIDRKWHFHKKYGVSIEWYEQKFAEQNGVCAICKRPEERIHWRSKRTAMLSVDHDHETNAPRGLLCSWCNKNLFVVEYPERFANQALKYLNHYRRKSE